MNVGIPLFGDGGFECQVPAVGLVVVADEYSGVSGQGEQAFYRAEEGGGVSSREITARCAPIGHEQCVADEQCITQQISHTRRSMARDVHCKPRNGADIEVLVVTEGHVELRTIDRKARAFVVNVGKGRLDRGDVKADTNSAADGFSNVGRCG